jgi:hypothetical protein
MASVREDDPEHAMLAGLLTAWARELGTGYSQRRTVAKLIATINEVEPGGPGLGYKHPELRDAIMATASSGKLNSRSLGWWLRRNRDRTVVTLYLREKSNAGGPAEWWVDAVNYPTGPQE